MGTCIICKKEKVLTDEHIVPEFLGGGLIIKSVCKTCNDKMGGTFEGRLSNSPIFTFPNFINKVKGKSGKIPNPLEGKKQTIDGENISVEFVNNKFKVKKYPKVSISETDNGDLFSMSLDPSDYHKAEKIIKTKINRSYPEMSEIDKNKLSKKLYEDLLNSEVIETKNPVVRGSFTIDFKDIRLLFIKIAYEIGFYHFGQEFIEQPITENLRKALYLQEKKDINGSMLPDIKNNEELFFEERHYIYLSRNICYMKIYDRDALIVISEINSQFDIKSEEAVIYEFDFSDNSYIKKSLREQVSYINSLYNK
jgi:hypothetical protein